MLNDLDCSPRETVSSASACSDNFKYYKMHRNNFSWTIGMAPQHVIEIYIEVRIILPPSLIWWFSSLMRNPSHKILNVQNNFMFGVIGFESDRICNNFPLAWLIKFDENRAKIYAFCIAVPNNIYRIGLKFTPHFQRAFGRWLAWNACNGNNEFREFSASLVL